MRFPRSSGVLLPVFSLPGPFGVGDLGPAAFRFVDFLQSAGQTLWQLLPLGPPAKGDSPYSCYSAFAGNPLLISPEELVKAGLLPEADLAQCPRLPDAVDAVSYEHARILKQPLLQKAFAHFRMSADDSLKAKFAEFCQRNRSWLEDYTRFDAIATKQDEANWSTWDPELVKRSDAALQKVDTELADEIEESRYIQFLFAEQWSNLKNYATSHGVRMYGDMPIFVAYDSADVWTHQDIFLLNEEGRSIVVAGVPPDYFSTTGQMWGNPLYRWDRLATCDYKWWTRRFQHALEQFDLLRIDHFRGFESYWEIPADAENAVAGRWCEGPGTAPFDAARKACGDLPIVAEDLGLITDGVHALRETLGFPGMRVLQFGFSSEGDSYHRPESYPENSVAYTGTHDNDTLMGWYRHLRASGEQNYLLDRYVQHDSPTPHLDLIRAVFHSAASTVVVPLQDLLGLGSEFRMNTPGEPKGNWTWRCEDSVFTTELSHQLRELTQHAGRI